MRGWLSLFAGVGLSAGIVGWLWRESVQAEAAPPRPTRASVRQGLQPALGRRAAAASVSALERANLPAASAPATPRAASEEPAAADEEDLGDQPTLAERQAEDRSRQLQLQAQFEQRFQAQAVDRTWGRTTEAKVSEALAGVDVPTAHVRLENVDCRSDICKSTLMHDSARPSPEFMLRFIMKAGVGLENHFAYADGHTTMYSLRRDDAASAEE